MYPCCYQEGFRRCLLVRQLQPRWGRRTCGAMRVKSVKGCWVWCSNRAAGFGAPHVVLCSTRLVGTASAMQWGGRAGRDVAPQSSVSPHVVLSAPCSFVLAPTYLM